LLSSLMWHGIAGKQLPTVQRNVSLSRSIQNKSQFIHRPWTLVPLAHFCVSLLGEGGGKCKRIPKINGITNALNVWEGDMM